MGVGVAGEGVGEGSVVVGGWEGEGEGEEYEDGEEGGEDGFAGHCCSGVVLAVLLLVAVCWKSLKVVERKWRGVVVV